MSVDYHGPNTEAYGNFIPLVDLEEEEIDEVVAQIARDVSAPHLYEEPR